MSDNPMLDVAAMANRISSGSLERIGKIQQDTFNRKLQREQLEQRTIDNEAALALQASNYENRINDYALGKEQAAYIETTRQEFNRKTELADQLKQQRELIQAEIPGLQIERQMAIGLGQDTSSLDAAIAAKKSQLTDIDIKQSKIVTGLSQPTPPVPSTPSGGVVLPLPKVSDPNAIGFDRYEDTSTENNVDDRQYYGPSSTEEAKPVEITGLNYTDEEKDLWIRTVAAEVGTQVDDDGLVKMAETVRNRHLMTGKPLSEILKPNYYETMRGDNPATSQVTKDSEVYQKSAAAVEAAIGGSNRANSATHNYYAPSWTDAAAKRNQADPDTVEKYQKEVYYKKRGESGFNFNNYVKGEIEINLNPEQTVESVGRQQITSGSAPADGSLFPPALRPDGGDNLTLSQPTLIATPVLEEDPELIADIDFFSSMDGDVESQVRFSDSQSIDTSPAFSDDEFLNPSNSEIDEQVNVEITRPVENPVNMDYVKSLNSTYNSMPEKYKAIYQPKLQDLIKATNPSVADEEIATLASNAIKSGTSSSVDFRNALPDYINNIVGSDRAMDIFNVTQRRIQEDGERNTRITQLDRDFESSEEKRTEYQLKLSQERSKNTKERNLDAISTLESRVKYYTDKAANISKERESLDPVQIEVFGPSEELRLTPEQVANQEGRADRLERATSPRSSVDTNNTPTVTNRVIESLSNRGINPDYLTDIEISDDNGIMRRVATSFGLDRNVNDVLNKSKVAYIRTKSDEFNSDPSKSEMASAAIGYLEQNPDQVIRYISNIPGLNFNDEILGVTTLAGSYSAEDGMAIDPLSGIVPEDRKPKIIETLKRNPALLWSATQAMLTKFDEGVKQEIVQEINAERTEATNRLMSTFGQIPEDK